MTGRARSIGAVGAVGAVVRGRRAVLAALVAGAAAGLTIPAAADDHGAGQDELALTRVTLYRSGVGFFERRGLIDGPAEISLSFDTDQINDILKSMVVLDFGGRVEAIGYGSKEPLSRRLSGFKVDISDNPSAAELLGRLRGARVRLLTAGGAVDGTVLGVEERSVAEGEALETQPFVNVLSGGIRSVPVNGLGGFEILDEELAAELELALAAIAEQRAEDVTSVDVRLGGAEARQVVVGYTHEMPVWKTSYRLVLTDDGAGAGAGDTGGAEARLDELMAERRELLGSRPSRTEFVTDGGRGIDLGRFRDAMNAWTAEYQRVTLAVREARAEADAESGDSGRGGTPQLQGWAIVENTTDEDWRDVTLSLVSGRPVSFVMDLYEPLFLERPEVSVPVVSAALPRVFERELGRQDNRDVSGRTMPPERRRGGRPADAFEPAPEEERYEFATDAAAGLSFFGPGASSLGELVNYGAAATATAAESGEVFFYELDRPVTVERRRSAMLPILTAGIEAERVSVFSESEAARTGGHPMRGARMTNTSDLKLLPGPIAVFDGEAYSGDAQIGHVGPGESRLLAFAVDLDVTVGVETSMDRRVVSVSIVDGVVRRRVGQELTKSYTLRNADGDRARAVLIEEPKLGGDWELVEPEEPSEETAGLRRFEVGVAAGEAGELSVRQRRTLAEAVALVSADLGELLAFQRDGRASRAVVDAVRRAQELNAAVQRVRREIAEAERAMEGLRVEQDRLRQNLRSVPQNTDLHRRYLTKLNEQETEIESLTERLAGRRAELERRERELAGFLRGLSVE